MNCDILRSYLRVAPPCEWSSCCDDAVCDTLPWGQVMLLKPSRWTYARGTSVLRRMQFDRALGFDFVGRPSNALQLDALPPAMSDVISRTRMVQQDDWNFVGGHACQVRPRAVPRTRRHCMASRVG